MRGQMNSTFSVISYDFNLWFTYKLHFYNKYKFPEKILTTSNDRNFIEMYMAQVKEIM
jgi:hypothetical protein